jgi:biopolymer transport protein ExbB
MSAVWQPLVAVRELLDAGGPVLWAVLGLAVLLWTLILERLLYIRLSYPPLARHWVAEWGARGDRVSWRARVIRAALVSQANVRLRGSLPVIRGLIALCPLFGLLGTVSGMIQVFDVVAVLGTGNPRALAAGVSRATMPTMAGLMVAVAGLYFRARIEHMVGVETRRLADRLSQG